MKIFSTHQIAEIDKYTVKNEPVEEVNLMERAGKRLSECFIDTYLKERKTIFIFIGPGNNGGDGLVIARKICDTGVRHDVKVYVLDFGKGLRGVSHLNFERLQQQGIADIEFITSSGNIPEMPEGSIVIDALFGSGLDRPVEGVSAMLINKINQSSAHVVSVDVPSGLMGEDNTTNNHSNIIKADHTYTFQFPKLAFMFSENLIYTGNWEILDIGLHQDAINSTVTPFFFIDDELIRPFLKKRKKSSHKGSFGHALMIAGAYGKMGASVLASKACLRAGAGLLTVHVPRLGYGIIQGTVPEAMAEIDCSDLMFTGVENPNTYHSIGVGPGIGQKVNTVKGLSELLKSVDRPVVLDADAINIIGANRELFSDIPKNSILTPHPKEFERLTQKLESPFLRMKMVQQLAIGYHVYIVLKGAYTMLACPDGHVFFNSTGNPGMATAGSGDVLTGVIVGLLSRGYDSFEAACLGIYLHGLAGDLAAADKGVEALIASDIIDNLGNAHKLMR